MALRSVTWPRVCKHVAVAMLLALACAGRARADDRGTAPVMRAGAFAQDITPTKLPISMNGGYSDHQATLIHDRLHARCLVLDDGTTKLAIVVCDSCALPRDLVDAAKRAARRATGIPPENMLISATHTHSAPTAAVIFQSAPDRVYLESLIERIAEGIRTAMAHLEPCRIGWAVGKNPDHVFNRRWKMKPGTAPPNPFGNRNEQVKMNPGHDNPNRVEPAGTVDPDVSFVAVVARDGRPIAVLANYALHFVGWYPSLSADYFGVFAERLKQTLKAGAVRPAFVGIMSNGTSGDVNNMNLAAPAWGRRPPDERMAIVADSLAQTVLAASRGITFREWAQLAVAVRLKPTFTIELANGYNGYLPTPEQHALGGYETWRARSSYLEVGASRKITETLVELLTDVARQPDQEAQGRN